MTLCASLVERLTEAAFAAKDLVEELHVSSTKGESGRFQ